MKVQYLKCYLVNYLRGASILRGAINDVKRYGNQLMKNELGSAIRHFVIAEASISKCLKASAMYVNVYSLRNLRKHTIVCTRM